MSVNQHGQFTDYGHQDQCPQVTYESWDLVQPVIPTRSILFQLSPIGVGTPLVESLSSYINRLADAHCLSSKTLITRMVIPLINKDYNSTNFFGLRNFTGGVNGTGIIALDLVQALEKLTKSNKIRYLSLLLWAEVFPTRQLLRISKAWCPYCYEEWRNNKKPIYEPLIWHFTTVKVCFYHKKYLVTNCPSCGQKLPVLSSGAQAGCCLLCHNWLGKATENTKKEGLTINSADEWQWHSNIIQSLGEVISVTDNLPIQPSRSLIPQSLDYYIQNLTDGNISALARQLQIPKNKLWMWQQGQARPQLDILMGICNQLGLSLLDFFKQKPPSDTLFLTTVSSKLLSLKDSKPLKKQLDCVKIEKMLLTILEDNSTPPFSLTEVANLIGHDKRVIRRRFPVLCKSISAKYLDYKRQARFQRINQAKEKVCQAVKQLYLNGKLPTELIVGQFLKQPGIFRDKEVREAFHEALRQLQVEP